MLTILLRKVLMLQNPKKSKLDNVIQDKSDRIV
jgi:hypothetical protein